MQRDPLDVAHRWRMQAEADLRYAETNLAAEHFALACFISQQAAEKSLKALLHWIAGDFPRTHRIADLLDEVAKRRPEIAGALRETAALDAFYTATRYPDALDDAIPDRSFYRREAELAFERASVAVRTVAHALPAPPAADGQ